MQRLKVGSRERNGVGVNVSMKVGDSDGTLLGAEMEVRFRSAVLEI